MSWRDMMQRFCSMHGLRVGSLDRLCKQIAYATLQYGKPYEELEYERLSQGKHTLFQEGTGCCRRQNARNMSKLCESGLVHRLRRSGESHLYALDPTRLVNFIRGMLTEHNSNRSDDAAFLRDKWKDQIAPYLSALESLSGKVLAFASVVGRNSKELITNIRAKAAKLAELARETTAYVTTKVAEKAATVAAGLGEVKAVVKAKAKAVVAQLVSVKPDADGNQPLFDKKGRGNGRAGLALWVKYARDHVDPVFESAMTGTLIGKMRHYLEELRAGDRTDDQIREHIGGLLDRWLMPQGRLREYQVPSKFGGERTCTLTLAPDFDVFYNERVRITRLLFGFAPVSVVNHKGGEIPDSCKFEQL